MSRRLGARDSSYTSQASRPKSSPQDQCSAICESYFNHGLPCLVSSRPRDAQLSSFRCRSQLSTLPATLLFRQNQGTCTLAHTWHVHLGDMHGEKGCWVEFRVVHWSWAVHLAMELVGTSANIPHAMEGELTRASAACNAGMFFALFAQPSIPFTVFESPLRASLIACTAFEHHSSAICAAGSTTSGYSSFSCSSKRCAAMSHASATFSPRRPSCSYRFARMN